MLTRSIAGADTCEMKVVNIFDDVDGARCCVQCSWIKRFGMNSLISRGEKIQMGEMYSLKCHLIDLAVNHLEMSYQSINTQ